MSLYIYTLALKQAAIRGGFKRAAESPNNYIDPERVGAAHCKYALTLFSPGTADAALQTTFSRASSIHRPHVFMLAAQQVPSLRAARRQGEGCCLE